MQHTIRAYLESSMKLKSIPIELPDIITVDSLKNRNNVFNILVHLLSSAAIYSEDIFVAKSRLVTKDENILKKIFKNPTEKELIFLDSDNFENSDEFKKLPDTDSKFITRKALIWRLSKKPIYFIFDVPRHKTIDRHSARLYITQDAAVVTELTKESSAYNINLAKLSRAMLFNELVHPDILYKLFQQALYLYSIAADPAQSLRLTGTL